MNKKTGVLFLFVILFLNIVFAAGLDSLENKVDSSKEKIDTAKDNIDKIGNYTYEKDWDYLGNEWKDILLKNKFISIVDSFLNKISIVFRIIIGVPYSLSFVFYFSIFLWIYFMLIFSSSFESSGFLSTPYNWLGGVLASIVLAQIGLFENLIIFSGRLIFSNEYALSRILIFIIIIACFSLGWYLNKKIGQILEGKEKENLKKELKDSYKKQLEREEAREASRKEASSLGDNIK